jgi:hypothetical protein
MADNKFSVYSGKFPCHTCKEEVTSLRLWRDTRELTWMCSKKHLSKVAIIRTKKDYEREKREQENRG